MRPRIRHPFLAAVLALASLGCGRETRAIKVGALLSHGGAVPSFGRSAHQGYALAAREWNQRGGIRGRNLQLILRDDQGDPAEGLSAATRLIEHDQVVALLGSSLSRVSTAAAPLAQAAGIPMVSPTSSDPALTGVGEYIFRVCFTDQAQGEAAAGFAWRILKARRAACIFDTGDGFPVRLERIFRERFRSLGGQVVASSGHPSGAGNVKPELTRLLTAQPDLLYIPDTCQDALLIAREARAMGFKGALLGSDGWDSPQLTEQGGPALEAACYTGNFAKDEDRPEVRAFVQAYRAHYQADPDGFAALAYDAANILFDAIHRAGSSDGRAIQAALAGTDYPAVSGRIRFDASRNPPKPPLLLEVRNGQPLFRSRADQP